MEPTIFEAVGGMPGCLALADAWHERCLADLVVSHAFSHGFHHEHTVRLATYWAEALGGPAEFSGSLGQETEVLRMHSGEGEHQEMDDRAIACFVGALADVGLSGDERLASALTAYFAWATAAMSAYPESADDVPDGLRLPRWDWSGLVPD
ncbi:MAG: oxidoreductase [Marmoricola sp.]|nr:oxidoreductase [Marmoricola sp.]